MWRSDANMFAPLDVNAVPPLHGRAFAGLSCAAGTDAGMGTLPVAEGGLYSSDPSAAESTLGLEAALRQSQRLALRYRHESEGLRQQLKAAALREQLLSGRLQDAYKEVASVKAEAAHARAPAGTRGDEAHTCEQLALCEQALEVMRVREAELEGRLQAYEEVWSRPPADVSSSSTPPLADVLCECWSEAEYLVKVVNAVEHCQTVPHDGVEVDAGGERCPRALSACESRCVAAAVKGNTERSAEVHRRGHGLTPVQMALALRETLQYCSAITAHCAALRPVPPATAGANDTTHTVASREVVEEPPAAETTEEAAEGVEGSGAPTERSALNDAATVAVARRPRHAPRPHTTDEDCHVQ